MPLDSIRFSPSLLLSITHTCSFETKVPQMSFCRKLILSNFRFYVLFVAKRNSRKAAVDADVEAFFDILKCIVQISERLYELAKQFLWFIILDE